MARRRKTIKKRVLFCALAWCFSLGVSALGYAAGSPAKADPKIDEKAKAVLMGMAETIAGAQKFTVTMQDGYDVVQDPGQKIEFGDVLKVTLNRPEQMRVEITKSEEDTGAILFDGNAISVYSPKKKAFASTQQPGGLDDSIPYFVKELQMRFPLAPLFVSTLPDYLEAKVKSLAFVETTTIGGQTCDHIAGKLETVDFQAWISQGDKPLLQRVVITYKNEKEAPQFWSNFMEWNLSPELSAGIFALTPPEGSEQIRFLSEMPGPAPKAAAKKGGRK